ncbi:S-adenosylmethionine-dependent methyltransferase [Solidesulfovibrio carbinoliphilus subsp. oakridgensis]|uniref:S-adenosylmethionine-dependent methyltransferase n=1 Tax=Solidesulfovibrio carbinoliphilus subsp. oakridgensis TaxID=694327 RepID=G7Q8I5_9BACT|nr:class I SAM-dependent rRNA methyltransferase [Solidesulfovibrio carbinoliphilus]EHJ48597.1 S-adenosylmethionine-dependent methyltransferase [Solidesulfovibrio carbinoliphilus subsp. oakridgensis]
MDQPTLTLRNNEERRLLAGHLWVFSNEVDIKKTPLTGFAPGQSAVVTASRGRPIGVATVNPGSLICARIMDRDPQTVIDTDFFRSRLRDALALRERLYATPHYRLLFSEGDHVPGLVLDRYGDVVVAQLTTAGMDRRREEIVAAIVAELAPKTIIFRNDATIRDLEGLPRDVETVYGTAPDTLTINEDGAVFEVPALSGQKTGWFYDMRENRTRLCRLTPGRTVLDLFAYAGAFSVRAALAGASAVTCLDSSETACAMARDNATRNGVGGKVATVKADAAAFLEECAASGRTFDVVSLDPPALVKRKKDLEAGLRAYERLNRLAMDVLADDGLLMTCSCSQHVDAWELRRVALRAAMAAGRRGQILEQGHQGPDHPAHPAMAETDYLKSFILRLLRP